MDFVWSSSVSTNLLAITCQVYTLLFRLFHPPPNTCVCVSTKGKNKKREIRNVVCGQRNEGGSIWWTPREEKKKGSSSLTWGWRGDAIFPLTLCVCDWVELTQFFDFLVKCVDESDIKIREGRNSTWRRFFVDQCLIFSFLPPPTSIHSAPLNLSLKGGYVYIDSKSTTNASSLSKYI